MSDETVRVQIHVDEYENFILDTEGGDAWEEGRAVVEVPLRLLRVYQAVETLWTEGQAILSSAIREMVAAEAAMLRDRGWAEAEAIRGGDLRLLGDASVAVEQDDPSHEHLVAEGGWPLALFRAICSCGRDALNPSFVGMHAYKGGDRRCSWCNAWPGAPVHLLEHPDGCEFDGIWRRVKEACRLPHYEPAGDGDGWIELGEDQT